MKTKKFLGCLAALAMTLPMSAQVAWDTNGNTVTGTDWFGADAGSTVPLRLETRANQPIDWYTNAIQRVRLNPNVTSSMGPGNPFPGVQRDGFLLLSGQPDAFTNASSRAPFTRLHLIDDVTGLLNPVVYAQEHGFRPWQRNGITFTGNSDQSYIGHKYDANDNTDFVIQWSDNPNSSPWGTDRLKMLFTTQYSAGAAKGAATTSGMEAMRFWPKNNTEVNVGVGDFAPLTVGDPTERLDVLDGRIRFRDLPGSASNNTLNKILVVDDAALPSGERGVIKWRDASSLWAADCRWRMNTGANNHLSTAFGADDPNCPDNGDAVAIGLDLSAIPAPLGKLTLLTNNRRYGLDLAQVTTASQSSGINVVVQNSTTTTSGIDITAQQGTVSDAGFPGSPLNYGVHVTGLAAGNSTIGYNFGFRAVLSGANRGTRGIQVVTNGASFQAVGGDFQCNDSSSFNYGVNSWANAGQTLAIGVRGVSTANATENYGVSGWADGTDNRVYYGVRGLAGSTVASAVAYGVYGSTTGTDDTTGTNGHTKWAGYFPGNTYTPGAVWSASDEQLKRNIEELPQEVAVQKLMQLEPKTYDFDQSEFGFMRLPTERQFGLIAQNVREVLPELVTNIHQPARLDTAGVEVDPAIDFSAMNYQGLIPLLVAGFKQQQSNIATLEQEVVRSQAQVAELRELLAACCANPDGSRLQQPTNTTAPVLDEHGDDRKLRIVPNPFSEPPAVHYTLERGGRIQLLVNSADGRDLRVLHEATMEAGSYQLPWDTNALVVGMYYVTLLLDGQPVVKKAVKVAR